MALATITGNRSDIAGLPDRGDLWFKPTVPTEDALSPRRVKATIADNGDFTIQLHPGIATVTIFNKDVPFVVPGDGGSYTLWSRIQAALELPPDTPQSKLNIAVANYIEGSEITPIPQQTTAPSSPSVGDLWLDTSA